MMATDYNQDGLLDLWISGKKRGDIHETFCLINTPTEGSVFSFVEETVPMVGMTDAGNRDSSMRISMVMMCRTYITADIPTH